jgi:insertion element IS1 protein InsB
MSLNGSGIRDTVRMLQISPTTVINELKKGAMLTSFNTPLVNTLHPNNVEIHTDRINEAAVDEMWSFVRRKHEPRWRWHAIDHQTGRVLAYVFGRRKDEVFLQLKALLAPFGITRFFTDHWGAYARQLAPETHILGKWDTQQIERKHMTLRTRIKRLVRKPICFSKSIEMHAIVIGLFVNRYEFGLPG